MKDCSSCADRTEIHPEYKRMSWEDVPCSDCLATEPFGRHSSFNDAVRGKENHTESISLLAHAFRCWLQLDELERKIMSDRVIDPDLSLSAIAEKHEISRPTLYKTFRRIVAKFPALSPFTPYKTRKRI